MKKSFTIMVLAMISACLMSCSSDDNKDNGNGGGTVVSPQLFGSWNLVNDADPTIVTTLTFTQDGFINYSATHTTFNPTIPANSPTYTREIVTTTPAYPIDQKEYVREQGYFTVAGNTITLWPQVSRNSTDGTVWTETAVADLPSMEVYSYTLNNNNVLVFTKGDGTKQTFIR